MSEAGIRGGIDDMIAAPTDERINKGMVGLIVAVATIGGFMFGYDSGVINGTQDGLRASFGLSVWSRGVSVAALLPGCAVGAFAAGRLADAIGRRAVMMIAALVFIASALVAGAAPSDWVFIAARFIAGLAVGAASVLAPVYISEVTPASVRGRLASVQQIMIIAGLTGAFLVNYWLAATAGHSTATFWLGYPAWRWMFWAQVIPAGLYFLTLLTIPDSPRYLVMKGRHAEAEVAAGTVYNYFQSKGDLLISLVALDGEEVRAAGKSIIASPPKDPVTAVHKLLTFYIDHSLIHLSKELWRNAMANALSQPSSEFGLAYAALDRKLADQVGELVASLQARGQIGAGIDPKTAGDVLFEVVNSLFQVFVAREEMPIALLKKALARQVRLVFSGLGNAEA